MELARSTYYDEPASPDRSRNAACRTHRGDLRRRPSFGYRRVTAELHATGCLVNHKKVMRLMQENGLSVRPRRRFVATTDSDHVGPIFPNLRRTWCRPAPTSSGSQHHLHRHRSQFRLSGGRS